MNNVIKTAMEPMDNMDVKMVDTITCKLGKNLSSKFQDQIIIQRFTDPELET